MLVAMKCATDFTLLALFVVAPYYSTKPDKTNLNNF